MKFEVILRVANSQIGHQRRSRNFELRRSNDSIRVGRLAQVLVVLSALVMMAAQAPAQDPDLVREALSGNSDAEQKLGFFYIIAGKYAEAVPWEQKAAAQGNVNAQEHLGFLYSGAFGVKPNYPEALTLLRKAAAQGNSRAMYDIGMLYYSGSGVKKDYAEAMAWYRKAATQGNQVAEIAIAQMYEDGIGVQKDYVAAMAWYRKALAHADSSFVKNAAYFGLSRVNAYMQQLDAGSAGQVGAAQPLAGPPKTEKSTSARSSDNDSQLADNSIQITGCPAQTLSSPPDPSQENYDRAATSEIVDVRYAPPETRIVTDAEFSRLKKGLHYSPATPMLAKCRIATTTLLDGANRPLARIGVQWVGTSGSASAPTGFFQITLQNMSNCEISPEITLGVPGSAIGADAVGSLTWGQWVALHDPSGGDSDSFQGTAMLNADYSSLTLKTDNPELALSQCRTKGQQFADIAWQTQDVQYNSQNGQAHVRYKESVSIDSGTVTENTDSTVQFIGNTGDYECRGPCTHEDLWTNSMAISDILAVDEGPYVGDDLKSDANDLWVVTLHSKGLGVATQGHAISGCTGTCADASTHSVAISIFFSDERIALAAKQALLAAASGR